jgi:hypothetical protein
MPLGLGGSVGGSRRSGGKGGTGGGNGGMGQGGDGGSYVGDRYAYLAHPKISAGDVHTQRYLLVIPQFTQHARLCIEIASPQHTPYQETSFDFGKALEFYMCTWKGEAAIPCCPHPTYLTWREACGAAIIGQAHHVVHCEGPGTRDQAHEIYTNRHGRSCSEDRGPQTSTTPHIQAIRWPPENCKRVNPSMLVPAA